MKPTVAIELRTQSSSGLFLCTKKPIRIKRSIRGGVMFLVTMGMSQQSGKFTWLTLGFT